MAAEKHVEDRIKNGLKRSGVYYYKNFANAFTNKGIPDIVGCGKQGRFFAIEVKRLVGGRPTPVQIRNLALIAKNNGRAFLACGTNVVPLVNLSFNKIRPFIRNGMVEAMPIQWNQKLHDVTSKQAYGIWHYRPKGCQVVMFIKRSKFKKYCLKDTPHHKVTTKDSRYGDPHYWYQYENR